MAPRKVAKSYDVRRKRRRDLRAAMTEEERQIQRNKETERRRQLREERRIQNEKTRDNVKGSESQSRTKNIGVRRKPQTDAARARDAQRKREIRSSLSELEKYEIRQKDAQRKREWRAKQQQEKNLPIKKRASRKKLKSPSVKIDKTKTASRAVTKTAVKGKVAKSKSVTKTKKVLVKVSAGVNTRERRSRN